MGVEAFFRDGCSKNVSMICRPLCADGEYMTKRDRLTHLPSSQRVQRYERSVRLSQARVSIGSQASGITPTVFVFLHEEPCFLYAMICLKKRTSQRRKNIAATLCIQPLSPDCLLFHPSTVTIKQAHTASSAQRVHKRYRNGRNSLREEKISLMGRHQKSTADVCGSVCMPHPY